MDSSDSVPASGSGWGYYVDLDSRSPGKDTSTIFSKPSSTTERISSARTTTRRSGEGEEALDQEEGSRWRRWLSPWTSLRHCYCISDQISRRRRRNGATDASTAAEVASETTRREASLHGSRSVSSIRSEGSTSDGWY